MRSEELQFIAQHLDLFCCPNCQSPLALDADALQCQACHQRFGQSDNIPQLFWPNDWQRGKDDVTERIKAFYEATPFPNYEEFDNVGSLIDKAQRRVFARLLDEQIPFGARVIECGCGTGQLSNFLSVANRTVIGADLCLNSLRLAQQFKQKNHLNRVLFTQMNLFRPCFKPGVFDLVISNGVLHHTSDPYLAFQSIARLVKPNGYILIGLYHRYGRLTTDMRRVIYRLTHDRLRWLDRGLAHKGSAARERAWFMDQYKNPHESKHTIAEVINWFSQNGFSFLHSVPKPRLFTRFRADEHLFAPESPGPRLERFVKELTLSTTASKDGGMFVVIGRKDASRVRSPLPRPADTQASLRVSRLH